MKLSPGSRNRHHGRVVYHKRIVGRVYPHRDAMEPRRVRLPYNLIVPVGAGGPALVCTQSNYLVLAMRSAGTCMHISTDEGLNWDHGTILDHPTFFNGSMIEVEPDVVLVSYPSSTGEIRPSYAKYQRIKIAPQGPIPLHD